MGHGRKVHDLLYRPGAEHGESGLAAGHDILMVAEDAQGVRSQCTCRHVEHAGQQLAGNLVHIGNHQQQALRGREGRGQGTGLQRAVHGTGGAGFRLHLLHMDSLTEDVLATFGCPLVNVFGHW